MSAAFANPHKPTFVYLLVIRGYGYFCRLWGGFQVTGREHVPRVGPAVVMANHASFLDPQLICWLTRRPICFMAKAELSRNPFWTWVFKRLMTIRVQRGAADISAFRGCAKVLANGALVGLFPEGTRTRDGHMAPAQAGAISIALKAGVPIIPTAITGTYEALRTGGPLRPVKIRVAAGRPMLFRSPTGTYTKQQLQRAGREVMREIERLMQKIQAESDQA